MLQWGRHATVAHYMGTAASFLVHHGLVDSISRHACRYNTRNPILSHYKACHSMIRLVGHEREGTVRVARPVARDNQTIRCVKSAQTCDKRMLWELRLTARQVPCPVRIASSSSSQISRWHEAPHHAIIFMAFIHAPCSGMKGILHHDVPHCRRPKL